MELPNDKRFKRLQRRLNSLEIRSDFDNHEEHKQWVHWQSEKIRLKDIIDYNSTQEKELQLKYLSYDNPKIKRIAEAIRMYITNSDIAEIVEKTKLSKSSIFNYLDQYKKNKYFLNTMYKRPEQTISKLEKYQYKIADDFETSRIRTYKEAQERIFKITGIKIEIPNIFNFLISHNFDEIDGCYKQIQTEEIKRIRLMHEKQLLNEKKDKIKEYIIENHLESDYRLVAKIRKEFNIRYVPRSWFSNYLSSNGMISNKK